MTCPYAEICGGCLRRGMSEEQYRETKTAAFRRILSGIKADFAFGEPVFVADGTRRRAAMAFVAVRAKLRSVLTKRPAAMLSTAKPVLC